MCLQDFQIEIKQYFMSNKYMYTSWKSKTFLTHKKCIPPRRAWDKHDRIQNNYYVKTESINICYSITMVNRIGGMHIVLEDYKP